MRVSRAPMAPMLQTLLAILFTTCCTLGTQLMLKGVVMAIARRTPAPTGLDWLWAVALSPSVWLAVLIQGIGFGIWVWVISRMKLGPAFAISGALFYTLLASASWALYGERLSGWQWAGIVLVSAGVVLMTATGQRA